MSIIKDIRESVNLSQTRLAKLSGVHRKTLYNIETRDAGCSDENLDKLAKTLAQFTDLAYIAGLFDRASTITITKTKPGTTNTQRRDHHIAVVRFTSKHRILCEIIQEVLGCGLVSPQRKENRWEYYAFSKEAGVACEKLLPYLKIKRERAKVLLEFRKSLMLNKQKRVERLVFFGEDLDWDSIKKEYDTFYYRIREV